MINSMDKFETMSIEQLDLTVRSYNCLKRAGIDWVYELTSKSLKDLMRVRNMGRKSIEEIEGILKGLGLKLRQEENDEPKTTPKV